MFTVIKTIGMRNGKSIIEGACLNADAKPTDNIANGSMAIEIDTGNLWMFDETNVVWNQIQ